MATGPSPKTRTEPYLFKLKRRSGIVARLQFWLVLIALLPMVAASLTGFHISSRSLTHEVEKNLTSIAENKLTQIEKYALLNKRNVTAFANLPSVIEALVSLERVYLDKGPLAPEYTELVQQYRESFKILVSYYGYTDMFLISFNQVVLFQLKSSQPVSMSLVDHTDPRKELFKVFEQAKTLYTSEISDFQLNPNSPLPAAYIAAPVLHNHRLNGVVALRLNNQEVYQAINDYNGLGQTGEILVGSRLDDQVRFVVPTRHDPNAALNRVITMGDEHELGLQRAVKGIRGNGTVLDYRGVEVVAAWRYLPSFRWGMVVKVDAEEAFAPVRRQQELIFVAAILLVICVLFSALYLARTLSSPVVELTRGVEAISKGNLSQQVRVVSNDELGELGEAFNRMSSALQNAFETVNQQNATLKNYSENLETMVWERTQTLEAQKKDLEQLNDRLQQAMDELQQSQSQLIQAGQMAALGHLSAGLAHEINTPIGTVKAAADNIKHAMAMCMVRMAELVGVLDSEHLPLFFRWVEALATIPANMSTREERVRRQELILQMQKMNLPNQTLTASHLVKMGVGNIEQIPEVLREPALFYTVVETAFHMNSVIRNNQHIHFAVERVSSIVFALKNFVHTDLEGEKLLTDLHEGLETVLLLHQHQLKHGIEVVREYSPLPPVYCYQDALNQVWANLFSNAIQAMKAQGVLRIVTRQQDNWLEVDIMDNGSGVDEAIQNKIFDPFFTTKSSGQGSGIGLDLCKKIIEKHQGEIVLLPGEGWTTFRVRIPILAA